VLVTVIVANLAEALGRQVILRSYPTLEPFPIDGALASAAELARDESLLPPSGPREARARRERPSRTAR
jgi:hypothetical protein